MRTVVIADSRFATEMIQRSLRGDAGIDVIGYIDGRKSCSDEIVAAHPHVVVFDEMVEPALALTRIREARAAVPGAKLVVLTGRMQEEWLAETVGAGADAAICKSLHPRGIAMLIRAISSGAVYHSFAQPPRPENQPASMSAGLTRREHEILQQVAEGASNGEIASRLCVTEQTVKFHLSNVYRKLGVANRTQASRYAHVHQLVGSAVAPRKPRPVPSAA
ncbi:MAG: response regulator transcription factor [Actinomycetota bacterium]|nr:response regulator transcription factor [Actinomycetota bacterium]